MRYLLIVLALSGCASQSANKTFTYVQSNGKVQTFEYTEPGTAAYKSSNITDTNTAVFTDSSGRVIGYGFANGTRF